LQHDHVPSSAEGWVSKLLGLSGDLTPHGYCLLWDPALVWAHVGADLLIAGAYFSIPIALVKIVRARRDIRFSWIFWLFALFITACGTTHLVAIYNLWFSAYELEAVIKVVTAIASVGTAIALWPMIPKILAIPSPLVLEQRNEELSAALERAESEAGERARAEEALRQSQKMEAVGQLTGGIAHDFNNLLQALTGSVSLIAANPTSPKVKRWAETAQLAADRGSKLTSQLLAFSRVQKLEIRPVVVSTIIEEMQDLLASTLGPQITLIYDLVPQSERVQVLGDPTQIELAVMNLAINARDATAGSGNIRITTRHEHVSAPELEEGEYLCLSVSDNGMGMTEEVKARAFDPFFTTKGVGRGTGLGLSTVYGMARQSGGKVELRSAPGSGTTVSIYLRIVGRAEEMSRAVESSATSGRPLNILLVDDDPEVRTVAVSMLEALGHQVRSAAGGPEALALIAEQPPELAILDFAMPEMNGAELAGQIRTILPHLPVIFATGYAETDSIRNLVGGAAPLIAKPFTLRSLSELISKTISN
jgi:signal transduction histidine kinase